MPVQAEILGFWDGSRAVQWRGRGFFGGLAPDPADPESTDGRFRVLNEPARGRIVVYERKSMAAVADTLSKADGTWRIDWLDPTLHFVVIGFDDSGVQNAAIQDWVKPAPME